MSPFPRLLPPQWLSIRFKPCVCWVMFRSRRGQSRTWRLSTLFWLRTSRWRYPTLCWSSSPLGKMPSDHATYRKYNYLFTVQDTLVTWRMELFHFTCRWMDNINAVNTRQVSVASRRVPQTRSWRLLGVFTCVLYVWFVMCISGDRQLSQILSSDNRTFNFNTRFVFMPILT